MALGSSSENAEPVAQPATLVATEIATSKDIEAVDRLHRIGLTEILSGPSDMRFEFRTQRCSLADEYHSGHDLLRLSRD